MRAAHNRRAVFNEGTVEMAGGSLASPPRNRALSRVSKFRLLLQTESLTTRAQAWAWMARHSRFSVKSLAAYFRTTPRQIERCCQEELGRSPQEWFNEQRLIAARALLLEEESIKTVAIDLGFKQVSHFCRQFKQQYGITPSEYLNLHGRLSKRALRAANKT